jgi:hypothetical protein
MKDRQFQRARVDCLSREFGDEVLVYDLQRDVGHCLNSTAAAAWKLCDGNNSPSQIARTLSRRLSAQVDEQVVRLALDQLANALLFVKPKAPVKLPSRRVAIRRIGIAAAIALPLVTSIVAPTAAQAASCFPDGHTCSSAADCCSGHCGLITQICGNILSPKPSPRPQSSTLDATRK